MRQGPVRARRLVVGLAVSVGMLAFASPAHALNLLVNNTGDQPDAAPGNSVCLTAGGVCTLRAALQESNAVAGSDNINFNGVTPPATINLTGPLPDIAPGGVDIAGPGKNLLTIRRDTGGAYRIFTVLAGAQLALRSLTITNGLVVGNVAGIRGGGILNDGELLLAGVVVTDNKVFSTVDGGGGASALGGGIQNQGAMEIFLSTISDNGVFSDNDFAGGPSVAAGGGIVDAPGATSEIRNSTISDNGLSSSALPGEYQLAAGGGLSTQGSTVLTNVTVSGNLAPGDVGASGGGVTSAGALTITGSTIAFNHSPTGANVSTLVSGSIQVRNTIISNPAIGTNCAKVDDNAMTPAVIASNGFNLVSDTSCAFTATGDQQGVDPLLLPLGGTGIPPDTHALPLNSPAVDKGNSTAQGPHPALTQDERTMTRPVDLAPADAAGGNASDIGAFELQIAEVEYAARVIADTPRGYWRFGEPSGTALLDSSGHNNHGTYLGGVALGALGIPGAAPNTAATYDGVNDTGRVPDSVSLDVGNTFTLEGWIKRSSDTKTHELFNKGTNGFQLVVMNAASLNRVLLRRAGITAIAQSTAPVPADGVYHHVVATMNGPGTAKIYIDGALASTSLSAVQQIQDTAFPLTFGSASSTPAQYDEFALYNFALTGAQVAQHYALGS